ncbi:MAG: lysoplasmalogenase [Propionibacteriaceae bacterium]|nr:lysoplasmalogenase [Propionibacteriaceae bacterium]
MTSRGAPHRRLPAGPLLRWAAFAVVVVVQLTALWWDNEPISVPAQSLLMPVLALPALLARPGWLRAWTLIALFFSFLGDTLPRFVPENVLFLSMLGSFFVAHLAWIVGLWRVRPPRPWLLIPYLAVGVSVVAWCWPGAGALAPALVAYAAAMLTTTLLALGLGWPGVVGGALFIVSDALIAARTFADFTFPQSDVVVMATYAISHGLLVLGVTRSPGHREGLAYSRSRGWHAP